MNVEVAGRMRRVSRNLGVAVCAIGAIVLFGWAFDIEAITRLAPGLATMKINTALGFVSTGGAIVAQHKTSETGRRVRVGLGAFVLVSSALTLLEYETGASLGIDQLLGSDSGGGPFPGRMSFATAFAFVFAGASLLAHDLKIGRQRVSDWLALPTGCVALVAVLGYGYDVSGLYAIDAFGSVALHTAIAFLAVAVSLFTTRPDQGFARVLSRQGPAGILARRFFPAAVLIPALLGFLRLEGQWHRLYGTSFGSVLFVTGMVGSLLALTWWNVSTIERVDVTRRNVEKALREREEDLATTLDSIGDAVIATDADGRVTKMNPVAQDLTGWRLEEAAGRELDEVFHIVAESDRTKRSSPVPTILRDGRVVGLANHTLLIARDGREYAIADSGAPILDANGKTRGVVLVFRDMTEKQRTQAALERSRARFARLTEAGIIGILSVDAQGRILEANDTFLRSVGHSRDDLLSSRVTLVDLGAPEWRDPTDAVGRLYEKELTHKNGTRVPVLIGIAATDDSSTLFVADLSKLRSAEAAKVAAEDALSRTEEQLRQSQKMEAIGRLAGGVAHDFNNMLSVILSYATMLLADLAPNDPAREDVREIEKAGLRAADLTRQLLMFSRQQVLEPKVIDLNDLLTGMSKMLPRLVGEDVDIVTNLAPTLGRVTADPGSMEQVVMNLVVNARDAMPSGGRLTIETANTELDQAYADAHLGVKPGRYVMIAVSDNGMGMDRATQARLFEPFFSTKARGKGTGLGLSTVFGIVQQNSGSIWVYSEVGQGTTFKVYLPRIEATLAVPHAGVREEPPRGTETILLVEDEDAVRAVARSILERQGYRLLVAQNAGEALLLCEAHSGDIDLLLTDVVMPQMGGPELAARLAKLRPKMRVLYMSGYTDDAAVRHGLVASSAFFLQKPITPESLIRKVGEVLGVALP